MSALRGNRRWLPGLLAALLAIGALGFSRWFSLQQSAGRAPLQLEAGTLITPPRPLQPFRLQDTRGEPFDNTSLPQRWSLLSFGYTHCPDVCPSTLAMLADVADQLQAAAGADDDLQVVFVSVDPERDSLAHLAEYLGYFRPDFLGATADQRALRALTDQLGMEFARAEDADGTLGYLVNHSAQVLLIDPEARWRAVFSPPFDPQRIARDLQRIRAADKSAISQ